MTDYRVDSHKLIFHPRRVADWLDGKQVYPILLEVGISGACNHRCVFCAASHMEHKPTYIDTGVLLDCFSEVYKYGLKSVLFAGNGEPTLHRDFVQIVNRTKQIGIDVALSTNGVLFTPDKIEQCLKDLSWIRFSVSGGTEETYKRIHCGKDGDLQRVFDNIKYASQYKERYGLKTTLGVQIVMTPETEEEIIPLAKKVKELGADLFTVKTVGYNPLSTQYKSVIDKVIADVTSEMEMELKALCDDRFAAVYRGNRAEAYKSLERCYKECHAAPFYGCIDSDGIVYPCCNLIGMKNMALGNLYDYSFAEIWDGAQRKKVMQELANSNLSVCVPACRLHKMNEYLQELKYPGEHVNFI